MKCYWHRGESFCNRPRRRASTSLLYPARNLKGDPHGEASPPTQDRQQKTQSSSRSPQAISARTHRRSAALAWRLCRSPLTISGNRFEKDGSRFVCAASEAEFQQRDHKPVLRVLPKGRIGRLELGHPHLPGKRLNIRFVQMPRHCRHRIGRAASGRQLAGVGHRLAG